MSPTVPEGYEIVSATIISDWAWAIPGFSSIIPVGALESLNDVNTWNAYCTTSNVNQTKDVTFTACFYMVKKI